MAKFGIGDRFGELLVLKYINRDGNDILGLCDCGEIIVTSNKELLKNGEYKCQCDSISYNTIPQVASNVIYGRYRKGAHKRNLSFNLSDIEFSELIQGDCNYCGKEPQQKLIYGHNRNKEVFYNGVDRIDSLIGYTKENCVSCCKACNFMKGVMGVDEFLKHINMIYQFSIKNM